MSRSILKLVVALAALSTIACAKKDNSLAARSIARPAGTSSPSVDAAAQQAGLNISWEKTEVIESGPTSATLQHTYTVNGKSQSFQQVLNVTAGECSDAYNMSYDAQMINSNSSTNQFYTALGSSACYDGVDLYVGLSFMAWTQETVTQQFVLLNISEASAVQIQKQVVPFAQAVYLPDWIAYQFN